MLSCCLAADEVGPVQLGRPEDLHKAGSALPKSYYFNEIGYLPDGTPLNMAGNAPTPDCHIARPHPSPLAS